MSQERIWLLVSVGAALVLAFLIFLPSHKQDQPELWSRKWDAIEYESPKGTVRIERSPGWFTDLFLIQFPGRSPRLASPGVKGFFADLRAPVVRGEYLLTEEEAGEIFAAPRCLNLIAGSLRREICAGRVTGGQAFVRLKEEPLRAYLMPEYIFGRLQTDPETYIDKRLVILPSGGVPRRITVKFQDQAVDLVRKKERTPGGDRVHWFQGDREISLSFANNLLSAMYDLQRDRMVEEGKPASIPVGEIVLEVATESPATEGIFKGAFGGGTIHVAIFPSRAIGRELFYPVSNGLDGSFDLVGQSRMDRLIQVIRSVKNAPGITPVHPPGPVPQAGPRVKPVEP